jgi:hypothetical protein
MLAIVVLNLLVSSFGASPRTGLSGRLQLQAATQVHGKPIGSR